jgi:hypothetical protein
MSQEEPGFSLGLHVDTLAFTLHAVESVWTIELEEILMEILWYRRKVAIKVCKANLLE